MRTRRRTLSLLAAAFLAVFVLPGVAGASSPSDDVGTPKLLTEGLKGGSGSAVGPDGALYVTEAEKGRLTRIDPETGDTTVMANCLPKRIAPFPGGAVDVTFRGDTAYVLVTLVGPQKPVEGTSVAGIYRIDDDDECTVIADIGTWSVENPPDAEIFVPAGVQFAIDAYGDGFLVTDGHHNRVLFVEDGDVQELIQLPNVVPTGLEVEESKVYLALAGPTPHLPEDGRIVSFPGSSPDELREVAAGAPLLVDVERCGDELFGLAQGEFEAGQPAGAPALPDTGELRVADDGELRLLVEGLDRPTSLTFIGHAAYVVTLDGEVWRIPDVCPEHHDDDDDDD